ASWVDVIAAKTFTSENVTYPKGAMQLDVQGGCSILPTSPIDRQNPYCVEFEVRCAEPYNRANWVIGVGLSWNDRAFESIALKPGRVILTRMFRDGSASDA